MYDDLGPEEINDVLEKLFTGKKAVYAPEGDVPYRVVGEVEEVIRGRLVRFVLTHPGLQRDREVSLFLRVDSVVGELWEHEVRNLLRLRMLGHPALPVIEDGRFDQSHQVAFIMTRQVGRPLPEEGWADVREWATTFPVVAFEQFSLLVDALSQLHGTRIVHRNLTLAAIRMTQVQGKASQATLSLARFELSALLNNLLHAVNGPQDRQRYEEAMRALFHTPPPGISRAHHLAYIAPETYPSVFGDVRSRRLDHGSTDVFGLGVLGWELFLDSLTDRLPEECAAVDRAGPDELPDALVRLHSAMRRQLNVDTRLPRPLRTALLEMLDPSPTSRSSSFEAASALQRNWTAISLALEPKDEAEDQRPRLVAFMPEQSVGTIHETRGWTDHRTDTPEGCQELKEFLEQELRQAELVHCPGGAEGYAQDGDRRSLAEAEWVLIGTQAVWFCAYLYEESVMHRRIATHKDTLVIKYLADKRYAGDLLSAWPRRRIGKFDLVPFYLGKSLADERRDRPTWEDLTDSVATERVLQDAEVQKMLRSFSFMLEYRGIVLKGRNYPYTLVKDDSGRLVLTHDKGRDRRWLHGDPLLTAYAAPGRRHRPPLGDFADQLLAENEFAQLVVAEDRNNDNSGGDFVGPYYGGYTVKVRIRERLDADSFVAEAPAGHRDLPESGWLRPYDDRGSEIQLRREVRGYDSLVHKAGLAQQLAAPRSIALRGGRVPDPAAVRAEEPERLRGRADDIIADMLKLHPFYALQGPPGTGKSTVVARALRNYLGGEYGARVLVSAQSNDALDQLAGKIIEELAPRIEGRSLLVLRELSKAKDRHDLPPALRRLTAEPLAEDLVTHIEQRVAEGCEGARPGEDDLMRRWALLARANMVELTERIKSGADIVLATCSIAGTLTDEIRDPSDMFDWVIIEEAAKAWPTEIIIPLALGVRWTLIGDYLQLGPHRAQDVASFLNGLASNQHERVRLHYEQQESYLEFVQLFRRFFAGHTPGRAADAKHPVDVLDMQFRMHQDISLPFATAFYPAIPAAEAEARPETAGASKDAPVVSSVDPEARTFLKTDPELRQIHRHTKPEYLKGAPLVWLDTSRCDDCGDMGYWWNSGEISLIEDLVREMGLADRTDPGELTVLTPYRRQVQELSRGFLEGRVHTVHSFQGGEARTVILSLVRSSDRGPDSRQNVGHTAQPEVVNVMLSRARSLLVVVGNMAHFERHGGADWQTVIQVFREVGRIVDASTGDIVGGTAAEIPEHASGVPDADAHRTADSTMASAAAGETP